MGPEETAESPSLETIDRDAIVRLLGLCNAPDGIITEQFVDDMYEVAREIWAERKAQGIHPYDEDELRNMLHGGVVSKTLHFGQTRHSGEDVWRAHLKQSVINIIQVAGRTRDSVLCGMFLHDIKEDTPVVRFGAFVEAWRASFKDKEDPLFLHSEKLCRLIWQHVGSATKDSRETREETSAATLRKLIAVLGERGPDDLHIKFAGDRLGNMQTIGHQKEDRRRPIAQETYEAFCKLGAVIGIQNFVRIAVDLCANVLNPKLLRDFHELRDRRFREQMGESDEESPLHRAVLNAIGPSKIRGELLQNIESIHFVPQELADFVIEKDEALENLTVESLSISPLAPLYQIKVIVKPGTDIRGLVDHFRAKLGKPDERYEVIDYVPDQMPQRGARSTLYSQDFGIVRFRINDSVSEARSKRGALPIRTTKEENINPVDPRLRDTVHFILRETRGDNVMRTLPLARELLLRPTITVYTPRHKQLKLPQGSTALDFAAAVHVDVLAHAKGAVCHMSDTKSRAISLFEPLKDGMILEIVTAEYVDDPSRVHFCRTPTSRGYLKKRILNTGSTDAIRQRGISYVERLGDLFGLPDEKIMELIRDDAKQARKVEEEPHSEVKQYTGDEKILEDMGRGAIDPLAVLSRTYFKDRKAWPIRVELEHKPGVLRQFLDEFAAQKMQADRIVQIPKPGSKPQIVRMHVSDFAGTKSPFDVMKTLLKLSYSHTLSVEHSNVLKRTGLKLKDGLSLLVNSLKLSFKKAFHAVF